MAAAELALLVAPAALRRIGVLAIGAASIGAVKFTSWHPERATRCAPQ